MICQQFLPLLYPYNILQKYMQSNRFQTLSDIFILIGLVIFGGIFFGVLGVLACIPVFNLDAGGIQNAILNSADPWNANVLKLFNLFATFGSWVVSAYVFIRIRQYDAVITWQVKRPEPRYVLWALPVICVALLFISSFLIGVNELIPFPDSIRSLNSDANQKVLKSMLMMENTNQLFLNILVIGLAPAIFEEIFFRGTLQRLLIHLFDNAHIGIFITSFIFAGVHLNIMQIVPMMFLALVLGYICYYTKSIWPSIVLHFLNNSTAVVVNYLEDKSELAKQLADDQYSPSIVLTIASFALVGLFFYRLIHHNKKQAATNHE